MISKHNADHYIWGDRCDGWRLVNTKDQSIIHEKMPAGTSEARHMHEKAKQFFFVLSGQMAIEVDGNVHILNAQEGIEVLPFTPHQVLNQSGQAIEFLVISQPNTIGDRINLD